MALRVEYLPLSVLTPAKRNPKRHGIAGVRASIGRFGYVEPMVRDDRTERLVAGHRRLESLRAMRDAGEEPPAGVKRGEDGDWLAPVLCGWASKSDADADAYLVASNRHVEIGGWDDTELAELLTGLRDANALDAAVGYSPGDLDKLLEDLAAGYQPPELDTSPKLADAFEHKIMIECEDESQQAELLEEFTGRGLKCRALAL